MSRRLFFSQTPVSINAAKESITSTSAAGAALGGLLASQAAEKTIAWRRRCNKRHPLLPVAANKNDDRHKEPYVGICVPTCKIQYEMHIAICRSLW